jgi:hypothetical protein
MIRMDVNLEELKQENLEILRQSKPQAKEVRKEEEVKSPKKIPTLTGFENVAAHREEPDFMISPQAQTEKKVVSK